MPELPDLQAFSRNLTKMLSNKKVERINVVNSKKLKTPAKKLRQSLEGAKITSVQRAGKELHFRFNNGNILGLHLMLRGQLHFFEESHSNKFPIIEILFSDNTGLVMTDFQGQAMPTLNPEPHDGVDALSKDVNYKFLKTLLNKSKATVKNLLLDQHLIRGIGNAYADEILWDAGISPFSVSNKIPDSYVKALAKSIKKVLKDAEKKILKTNPEIISGEIRDFLKIHNAKKNESPTGGKIKIDKTGSRKTYYTDEQKLFD
jgi:formamidopyrimidine-DNA glycosylase